MLSDKEVTIRLTFKWIGSTHVFRIFYAQYSHLFNKRGAWNKRGGWDFLEKKLVHKCNKRGVEGGKNLRNQ